MRSRNPADLLIIVALVIMAGVGGAWFWLRDDAALVPKASASVGVGLAGHTLSAERFAAPPVPEFGNAPMELELAKLALDAGQYVEPAENSALTHYLNALGQQPGNPQAIEGIETVVRLVADQAQRAIAGNQPDEATRLLERIRDVRPSDPRVLAIADQLASVRGVVIGEAEQLIAAGSFDAAETKLKEAQQIDGSAEAIAAARRKIADGRRAVERKARAEAEKPAIAKAVAETQQREADDAAAAAVERLIENAHASLDGGRLLEPADDSARRYVGDLQAQAPEHREVAILRDALVAALVERATAGIGDGDFESAVRLLDVADEFGGIEATAEPRGVLVAALAAAEGRKTIPANRLEIVRYVPPEYPSLAVRRKVEGWVDVSFVVTEVGATRDIEIISGEKDGYFKGAAIDAVSQWQFKPRVIHGQAIAQHVSARLTFQFE